MRYWNTISFANWPEKEFLNYKGFLYIIESGVMEGIRESEPDKRDKGYAWLTAIGIQAAVGFPIRAHVIE